MVVKTEESGRRTLIQRCGEKEDEKERKLGMSLFLGECFSRKERKGKGVGF